MSHTVPPARPDGCGLPWCQSAHLHSEDRPGRHWQEVAAINPGPATVYVNYASDQADGGQPFAAVTYGLDYVPADQLDIPFPAAAALADLLQLLDGATLPQLVHALRLVLEGPRPIRRRVRWGDLVPPVAPGQDAPSGREEAAGSCPVWAWCRSDHEDPVWADSHSVHLGQWRIGPLVVDARLLQSGSLEPVVAVELVRDDGKLRRLELDAVEVRAVSEVLDMFAMFDPAAPAGGVGEMLHRAGDTIDPTHERETPW